MKAKRWIMWIMTTISSICWYALLEIASQGLHWGCTVTVGNLYFRPAAVMSRQNPQDSLVNEHRKTKLSMHISLDTFCIPFPFWFPAPYHRIHLLRPWYISLPTHKQVSLPALNEEVVLCLAQMSGTGYWYGASLKCRAPALKW